MLSPYIQYHANTFGLFILADVKALSEANSILEPY